MEVTGVSAAATLGASAPAAAKSTGAFGATLGDQRRRLAARDVMTSMPPMVAEQIQRSSPGGKAPVGAVDALFKAIQSGEFRPSPDQLAASDSLIATTARAVQSFDSAEQMWQTMRDMLGSIPAAAGTTSYLAPVDAAPAATTEAAVTASSAATTTTPSPTATEAPAKVTSRAQAESILGGPLTALQMNWWETAIHFLLDEARAAASRTPVAARPPDSFATSSKAPGTSNTVAAS